MSKLAVMVPSRGRPKNIERLINAWVVTEARATLVVGIDNDDESFDKRTINQLTDLADHHLVELRFCIGGPVSMVYTLNEISRVYSVLYDYVGFMGDDHLPQTPHWDARMIATLAAMGTGIVYGNDLMQREALPTAVFMTSDIIQTLGYMAPPLLKHLYVDNAWRDWGQGIKRFQYLDDVVIEHMHPQAGKAEWDDGHIRVNGGEMWDHDVEAYRIYCKDDEANDLTKLRALI